MPTLDKATQNEPKKITKKSFARLLKTARNELEWTQFKLAEKSSVAVRTIISIENAQALPKKVVVIRLAYALGTNIKEWLISAGYADVSDKYIDDVITAAGHLHFAGERDPEGRFRDLDKKLVEEKGHILMCVVFHSPPKLLDLPHIKNIMLDAINHGLSLALVCPFPRILNLASVVKPALSFYYQDVYNRVVALAREIFDNLSEERRNCVGVFVPQTQQGSMLLHHIHPPTGLGNYRPCLIVDMAHKSQDSAYELAVWITMAQDQRNRWLTLYPSKTATSSKYLHYHKDYFSDFIAACSKEGWDEEKLKNTGWCLEFPIKIS